MSLPKSGATFALAVLFASFASCGGGGSSSDSANTILAVVQDLTVDPDGTSTVITFRSTKGLSGATTANFESDGAQTPATVTVVGDTVTIEWNDRVTPSHQVRVVGLSDVVSAFHAITASDSDPATFTITSGTQTTGLGGDQIQVSFAGARVIESEVEDASNWVLSIDGTVLDLTGTTIAFTPSTQIATFTLGDTANLHASFDLAANGIHTVADVVLATTDVAGTATGDSTAPTLTSVVQNLDEDEFGRVVDFTFSEAMDPVFSTQLSRFGVPSPDIAVEVTQPSENVLRVAFNNPIVPGTDEVTLTDVVDCHGNAFPDGAQAVTQPAPVTNAFDGTPAATTVANSGGDTITVVTTQAFDPDSAVDPANWDLEVASTTIDLADQTLEYDLLTKTLTITLDFDMLNGDSFTITGLSALDVDGDTFTLSSGGSAAGDSTLPTILSATQDRNVDPTGATVIVRFSEDVEATAVEFTPNWTITGGIHPTYALRSTGGDAVELVFTSVVVPGDVTLDGTSFVDLAGNAGAPITGVAIATTDSTRPALSTGAAAGVAGANNDTVTVEFDDDMIASEVETVANWLVESPIGTSLSTTGTTIEYDAVTRSAVLTFANGIDFTRGDDFSVELANCRDIAGNIVTTGAILGAIDAETTLPEVHTVYRDALAADELVVRFTEPCAELSDLYDATTNPTGTRYVLRDSGGVQRGLATSATALDDGLGVRISFGIVIATTDTLDVLGVTDRCGNPMFPATTIATVAEDTTTPSLFLGASTFTATTGETNDSITIVFDRAMSPWNLLAPANYTITGPTTFTLSTAVLSFDGDRTVTIGLRANSGHNLQTGGSYTLAVNDVWSAQGAHRTSADTEAGILAVGDSIAPVVPIGKVRLDPANSMALLIEADEALDTTASGIAASFDYDGGNVATYAERIGPRTVQTVFSTTPSVGHDLQFTVQDLAGNVTGTITRAVTAADAAGPLVSGVTGVIQPGWGGDVVTITYNEPVTGVSGLVAGNYSIQTGTTSLNLTNARISYQSGTNTVSILLQEGQELDASTNVNVTVGNVHDFSGNAMASQITVGGTVTGDSTAPSVSKSFVNLRADATGRAVDVLFSEDVNTTFAGTASNWTATGGPSVTGVTVLERNHVRLALSAALGASATLSITGVPDLARNASGLLTTNPIE